MSHIKKDGMIGILANFFAWFVGIMPTVNEASKAFLLAAIGATGSILAGHITRKILYGNGKGNKKNIKR